ncbi:MAG TPA: HAMP domain-containing protein, partial [Solirubrobacteraceae bacterium]
MIRRSIPRVRGRRVRAQDSSPSSGSVRRRALGLTRRFQLILVILVIVLGGVGWVGLSALAAAHRSLESIYRVNVADQQVVTNLSGNLDDAAQTILRGWVKPDRRLLAQLTTRLTATDLPEIELGIEQLSGLAAGNSKEERIASEIAAHWIGFETLWGDGQWGNGLARNRGARIAAVTASLDALTNEADEINALENGDGTRAVRQARADAASSRQRMILALALGAFVSLATILWLTRAVLPRILAFSRFAGRIAEGDYAERLEARGDDELGHLGRTLDDVAESRQQAQEFERTQAEFSESLQLIGDEREAQELVRRHLERSIPTS